MIGKDSNSMSQEANRPTSSIFHTLGVLALLAVILAAAAYFRFVGLDWDIGHHLHPDERFLSLVESAIQPVMSLRAYFDTVNSTLNPNNVGYGFFVYGTFPVILVRNIGQFVQMTTYYDIYLVGRAVSAIADLLTLLILFLIAWHLFDSRVALLAAALYAATALPIQQSHFFTVDTTTTLFATASFLFAVLLRDHHNWLNYLLFGLMLGLGMASKISVAPLALILVVAVSLRVWEEVGQVEPDQTATPDPAVGWLTPHRRQAIVRAAVGLVAAGMVTIFAFRIWQPYAFLPPNSGVSVEVQASNPLLALLGRITDPIGFQFNPSWLAQMREVRQQVSGFADIPPNHQWGHRLPLVFPWLNMVRVGMGWPLGVTCWLAFLWALWEIGRGHRGSQRLILPAIWIGLFFTWQGIGWVTTMRYFLPVYPFLILLAAWAILLLWDRVQALIAARRARRWHWTALLGGGLGVLILLSAYGWGFAVSRIYTRPVTRVAATTWMLENIPSDVTLLFDTPDGPRQYQLGLPNNWSPPDRPEDDPTQPVVDYTFLAGGIDNTFHFTLPFDGTLTAIRLNHVAALDSLSDEAALTVRLSQESDNSSVLVEQTLRDSFAASGDARGDSYELTTAPHDLTQNTAYFLYLTPSTPLIMSGATLATEGAWDDPVPLSTAPYNIWGNQYQGYELEMAWEDTADKQARLQYVLDHSDYLTISSNRFYDSMRRNPQRYPLTIAYYRALFGGELGFDLVADFTSRPNLGPIEFHDDSAEEAWTVYDHPRVMIFQKTDAYSPERTAALLGGIDFDTVVRVIAKDAAGPPARITLPSGVSAFSAGGRITGDPTNNGQRFFTRFQPLTVLIWWLLISLIGWAAFPTLYVLLPGLPDRGYPLSRVFGLLFGAWLSWLVSSLTPLPWTGWVVLAALAVLAALSILLIVPRREAFVSWLRSNLRHLLLIELIAFGLFMLFVLIRLGNPDLWHPAYGGEKPMDLAYFNAVLNSRSFPPYDPWFAGGTINYYYFGFVLVGAPLKLVGIPVTLAYNLILPTLFSLTGIGAFSAAYNLVAPLPAGEGTHDDPPAPEESGPTLLGVLRGWPNIQIGDLWDSLGRQPAASAAHRRAVFAGLAALLMSVLLGNLDQIRTILWSLAELGSGSPAYPVELIPSPGDTLRGLAMTITQGASLPVGLGEWYWNATRLIPVPLDSTGLPTEIGPITEFPYFTFLYADLHAHMIALPLTLFALTWSISLVRGASTRRPPIGLALLNGFVGALAIGALRPTNTWDWPTYLLVGLIAVVLATAYRRGSPVFFQALGLGAIPGLAAGAAVYLFLSTDSGELSDPGLWQIAVSAIGGVLAGIAGFGIGLRVFRDPAEAAPPGSLYQWGTLLIGAAQASLLGLGTAVLYLPFILNYTLEYTAFIPWTGSHTPLWAYVDIQGLSLFIIVSWIAWETWRWTQSRRQQGKRIGRAHLLPIFASALLVLGVVALAYSKGYPVALITLPLLSLGTLLFVRREQPAEKRITLALMGLALILSMVVEVVVLQGDLGRMNTVFKFYLQVWMLLAIVAGAALSWLWPAVSQAPRLIRFPWLTILGALAFLSVLYPLTATQAKVADRWAPETPATLDGMAYMQYAVRAENGSVFSLAPDYHALRWLQDNVEGTPVILEAQTVEYNWGSRVSVYTGLPTVLGWNWHQRQQRPEQSGEIWTRATVIPEIYNTLDTGWANDLLESNGVDLIMVGELERAYYEPSGLAKFDDMVEQGYLSILYERDNTIIYQVR